MITTSIGSYAPLAWKYQIKIQHENGTTHLRVIIMEVNIINIIKNLISSQMQTECAVLNIIEFSYPFASRKLLTSFDRAKAAPG